MKRSIYVSKYKVPIQRVVDQDTGDETVAYKEVAKSEMEFISKDEHQVESVFLKLQEITQEIKGYNNMQIKIAEQDTTRDYIYKKIITKE